MPAEVKTEPKKRPLKIVAVICAAVIIVAAVGGWVILAHRVNCTKLANNAVVLVNKKEYSQAYTSLQPDAPTCTAITPANAKHKSVQAQVQSVRYGTLLAEAAFQGGNFKQANLKQAAQYADESLKLYVAMTPAVQQQIPGQQQLIEQAFYIDHEAAALQRVKDGQP